MLDLVLSDYERVDPADHGEEVLYALVVLQDVPEVPMLIGDGLPDRLLHAQADGVVVVCRGVCLQAVARAYDHIFRYIGIVLEVLRDRFLKPGYDLGKALHPPGGRMRDMKADQH